jgi:hypothetical protein
MSAMNRMILVALFAIGLMPIASPAHAYLDPGTGSMILQIILGGIAGLLVAGKLYWQRVKDFFGLSSNDASGTEKTGDPDSD